MNEVPPDPRSTYCYLISRRSSLSSVVVRPRFTRRCTPTVSKMTAKFWGLPTTIVPFESLETAPVSIIVVVYVVVVVVVVIFHWKFQFCWHECCQMATQRGAAIVRWLTNETILTFVTFISHDTKTVNKNGEMIGAMAPNDKHERCELACCY